MNVKTLMTHLEQLAPKQLAESWDNVGLLVGDETSEVTGVLVTLDVSDAVVNEAIAKGLNTIVAHHPLIFQPLKTLTHQNVQQALLRKIIKHDINVYAMHTNLDNANGGMNDWLAQALALEAIEILKVDGEYNDQPYGTGRIGTLTESMTLGEFVCCVEKQLQSNGLRYVGDSNRIVSKVAIIGGAAQHYYTHAIQKQADVYITGDVTYHVAQDMFNNGLALIDPGHYIEVICIEKLVAYITPLTQQENVQCVGSTILTDVLTFK